MTAAAGTTSGEALRGLIITALADRSEPISTSELRRSLAAQFNVYVMTETMYRGLAILERRGQVAKLDNDGRRARWVLRADTALSEQDVVPAVSTAHAARPLRNASDCVKLVGLDGTLLHMNQRGCQTLGLPLDETDFGMPWLELLPSSIRGAGMRALQTAAGGTRTEFIGKTVGAFGEPTFWQNSLTPVADDDGRAGEILCLSRDVTDAIADRATRRLGAAKPAASGSRRRAPSLPGGKPMIELAGTFQQRLNALFAGVQAPDRGGYSNSEVVTGLAARGVHISGPYLSQLRAGLRERPSESISGALCDFFGVRAVYLAAEYRISDLPYLTRLISDLRWLALAHDPDVRRLTSLVLDLGENHREELFGHLAGRAVDTDIAQTP
ncbi:PAS domain-containing protein [Mycolicibacterium confluentis]|uniref:Uncharacterized protein n=1 Tax=Mycolicibacterium confluentis TaxID=28047 RepID=A0A7I7XR36_9MYCO|nr:PAS domain-containing protein [Mycolicibacterium confluentis]MCV7318600.1 PAS domain-containing protein [Mycolicibacterium confluentis]ORV33673.1 hypothetical protein AWB99_07765 [Mycolicibacterium confluentis]BBZ31747.1 hypothetical protein MCNF_03520 [Mycolicibacterium confluentis]